MDKFLDYNQEFIEYIERQSKFKKYFKYNDIFKIICRITYLIGDPIQNWIILFI